MASRYSTEQISEMIRLYSEGLSVRQVAARLGCPYPTVNWILKRKTQMRPNRTPPRYSEEQQQEMVRRYGAGETLAQVGQAFGCDGTCILKTLRRRGVPTRPKSVAFIGRKQSVETRRKMSVIAKARGSSHNLYIDGKGRERQDERKREMVQLEYRLWRTAVFTRDDHTCQGCGVRGGTLRADHIKPWHSHPECRYDVDNGRTLCDGCHKKTPTYGRKAGVLCRA